MIDQRIFLLGLDSATWNLLDEWINQGLLPNLAQLRRQSLWGDLESTIHPITASAWVSLLTGKNSGKHGIYDFMQRRDASYAVTMTNASNITSRTIYDLLSDAEKRVISINMPYTFPPKPINGSVIAGLFAPATGPQLTYPRTLWDTVQTVAPRYSIAPDYNAQAYDPLQQYIDDMHDSITQRSNIARWLINNEEWDLFTLVYTEPDEIQHAFWHCLDEEPSIFPEHRKYGNPILSIYQHIDKEIGTIFSLLDEKTQIWVVSDHGATGLKYWMNINRWLDQQGMLRLKSTANAKPIMYRVARLYKKMFPNKIRRSISKILGQRFDLIKARLQTQLYSDAIDWSATQAYALGAMGSIYINLTGREPHGIVSLEQYDNICSELIERLEAFKDPNTNESPIAKVVRGRDLYHGSQRDKAPDLVIIWRDPAYNGRSNIGNTNDDILELPVSSELSQLPLTGTHDYNGIIMICSKRGNQTCHIEAVHIQDVAPSLLHSFGLPIPDDMDGKVISYLENSIPISNNVEYKDFIKTTDHDLTDEETALVEKRLSELGYL